MFDNNLCLTVSNKQNDNEDKIDNLSEEELLEFDKEYKFQINHELPKDVKLQLLCSFT